MKKAIAIIVTCLMVSFGSVVSANGITNQNDFVNTSTSEEILAVYEVDSDGNLVEVPLQVYYSEKNKENFELQLQQTQLLKNRFEFSESSSNVAPLNVNLRYEFLTEHAYDHHKSIVKVSNAINCNSTTECPITTGWSTTTQHEFSTTFTTSEKYGIAASIGYGYTSATSKMLEYTLPVPVGKRAYVGFAPKVRSHYGLLITSLYTFPIGYEETSRKRGSVQYPLKNSDGSASGYYILVDDSTGQPL